MKITELKPNDLIEITGSKGEHGISDPFKGKVCLKNRRLFVQATKDCANPDLGFDLAQWVKPSWKIKKLLLLLIFTVLFFAGCGSQITREQIKLEAIKCQTLISDQAKAFNAIPEKQRFIVSKVINPYYRFSNKLGVCLSYEREYVNEKYRYFITNTLDGKLLLDSDNVKDGFRKKALEILEVDVDPFVEKPKPKQMKGIIEDGVLKIK